MLDYLEESYESGDIPKVGSVFTEEAVLTVGYDMYVGEDEVESFWDHLFGLSPNMSYTINQTDTEESKLFGILDIGNGGVFEYEIEYDPDSNLVTDAILIPSNGYVIFRLIPVLFLYRHAS